ncbi:MAG: hypothetical protein Q8O67_09390 [Deltaproteobacteria bacterium]|nr:hypothetical protein [Deltaproteobacteria bacterium]
MRQTSPRSHPKKQPSSSSSSSWKAILVALGTAAGAVVALSSSEPPARAPRSEVAARAEDDTRALLDERMALHLRRLR